MFAVVKHYADFKNVVPIDSFERYRQVLIKSGNDAIITDAWLQEWADFRKPHLKMSDEEYEDRRNDILFKWAKSASNIIIRIVIMTWGIIITADFCVLKIDKVVEF